MSAKTVLDVRHLSVDFLDAAAVPAHALVDVGFGLQEGEIQGVVGESGCGKTTLMLSLLQLLPANGRIVRGQVVFNNQDLLDLNENDMRQIRGRHIAMVFQGAMNALNPVHPIGRQIGEVVQRQDAADGSNAGKPAVADRVAELLELVGINRQRQGDYPHQFSGGMRQRVMIAMALAGNPQILIADEPTTALDVIVQAQILDLLQELRERLRLSILLVTHDLGVVAEICDSVLVMYGGETAEYAPVDDLFNWPQHPYTQKLLQTIPHIDAPSGALKTIPGHPPSLNALPTGCRFAPRCDLAVERCASERPTLVSINDVHQARCHLLEPFHG